MTNPYKAQFVLTPGQAMHQAGDTAQTYLARALRIVAETNHLPHLPGIPNSNPFKYPEIVSSVVQAQCSDYLAYTISEAAERLAGALESASRDISESIDAAARKQDQARKRRAGVDSEVDSSALADGVAK